MNKTRRDRIRNTVIREEVKVEPVIQTIQKHALRWFGHITRMSEDRCLKLDLRVQEEEDALGKNGFSI